MRFLAIVERKYSFKHNIILSGIARLGKVFPGGGFRTCWALKGHVGVGLVVTFC